MTKGGKVLEFNKETFSDKKKAVENIKQKYSKDQLQLNR